MAATKTRPTEASVEEYLASRADAEQRKDCTVLLALCEKATKQKPRMWGPSIVGFGSYTYRYDSGHSGEMCLTGFAVRGRELVVYVDMDAPEQAALLARLGKYRRGKVCLYLKRLADLDLMVLEALIAGSVAEVRRSHPDPGEAEPNPAGRRARTPAAAGPRAGRNG